jgi:hypothetical protein
MRLELIENTLGSVFVYASKYLFFLIHVDSLVFVMVISPHGSVAEVNNSTCDLSIFSLSPTIVNNAYTEKETNKWRYADFL